MIKNGYEVYTNNLRKVSCVVVHFFILVLGVGNLRKKFAVPKIVDKPNQFFIIAEGICLFIYIIVFIQMVITKKNVFSHIINSSTAESSNNKKNTKKWITVEPVIFAFGIPFYLQTIAIQNFALEQSCRVNLQFSAEICDNMIDKSLNSIDCSNATTYQIKETVYDDNSGLHNTSMVYKNFSLEQEACRAEIESQKLISIVSGYMAPIESITSLVIILIGGYWSDKTGRRKPLILLPLIGEMLSLCVYIFGAFFITQLPVQFVVVSVSLFKGMSGGLSLMYMGIFCYLTEMTAEKDRSFRIGLFYQIYALLSICTLPFSGVLYRLLGYVSKDNSNFVQDSFKYFAHFSELFSICLLVEVLGISYTLLTLNEPKAINALKPNENSSNTPVDRKLEGGECKITENNKKPHNAESKENQIKDKVVDAVNEVLIVLMRQRNGNGKIIIWLILFSTLMYVGCEYEIVNEYFFVRAKLNWEALEESPFAAFGGGTTFVGNILMTTVFKKCFDIHDAVIGLISSVFSTVSKFLCILVSTTFMLYVARSLDMFKWACDITNRSILTTIIDSNEIARVFSLMGLLESFGKFAFVPIYSFIYKETVDTFPNAYFIVSFIAMATVTAIFGVLCHLVIGKVTAQETGRTEMKKGESASPSIP
ncbi:Thymic stromal cotransporter like [Pseudolycoriella hygida]|uniref:Thymic stromal cotransporter like n=1 Tax=Pseudolycoriella hygida TaxID=35572 RepID=A0A9Q0N9V0_9DIPT|nr:Thymic stromal cotransporter like [Pseudolycoriella hygida]